MPILGATGAVGREMMKILAERSFPVEELRLLASPRSAGQKLLWQGRELTVQPAEDSAFEGMDVVLGAAENDIAKRFAPAIVKAGAVFVDNSSAFRMDPNVPLVIPEINPEDVRRHKGIIANPNCTTIVSLVAINALNQDSPIQSIIASSYQAVSGAGAGGPRELMEEVELLREGKPVHPQVFQYQIAYNVIPQIGGEAYEGYTSEEMKMQNEGPQDHASAGPASQLHLRPGAGGGGATASRWWFVPVRRSPSSGPESSSPPPPAAVWWTIWPTDSTPCRWTPAIRTPCSWAASGRI